MKPFLFLHNSELWANWFPEEPKDYGDDYEWEKYNAAKAEAIASGLEISNSEILQIGSISPTENTLFLPNSDECHILNEGQLYRWPGSMVKEGNKFKLSLR